MFWYKRIICRQEHFYWCGLDVIQLDMSFITWRRRQYMYRTVSDWKLAAAFICCICFLFLFIRKHMLFCFWDCVILFTGFNHLLSFFIVVCKLKIVNQTALNNMFVSLCLKFVWYCTENCICEIRRFTILW